MTNRPYLEGTKKERVNGGALADTHVQRKKGYEGRGPGLGRCTARGSGTAGLCCGIRGPLQVRAKPSHQLARKPEKEDTASSIRRGRKGHHAHAIFDSQANSVAGLHKYVTAYTTKLWRAHPTQQNLHGDRVRKCTACVCNLHRAFVTCVMSRSGSESNMGQDKA